MSPTSDHEADAPVDVDDDLEDDLDDDLDDEDTDDEDTDDDDIDGNRVVAGLARDVLTFVAQAIVEDRDAVVVETSERRNGIELRLHVAPDDMGKVIGKRGHVAQAIRAVVRAAGAREGLEVSVDIVD